MAITNVPSDAVLRLRFQTGTDDKGNPIYKNKNFNRVKPDAQDEDLFDVAFALSELVDDSIYAVFRINTGELVDEG